MRRFIYNYFSACTFYFREFARDLITSIPANRLNSQKLTCIHDMVKSELFENEGTSRLVPATLVVPS